MSATVPPAQKPVVYYPDSDGEPMADNTVQFDWIAILKWNAEAYLRDDPAAFVAGDHLIYPVEDHPEICLAPDVYVAFGRPKGDRGSYKVWEEGDIFPQVVIEVWSPNNRTEVMQKKFEFYDTHGALEYYIVYPEFPAHAAGWRRDGGRLAPIEDMNGYTSPRLGFRFALQKGELKVFGPDGRQLRKPDEIAAERDAAERELVAQRQRAEHERGRAEHERQRAEQERRRADQFAAKLRALGVDPDAP